MRSLWKNCTNLGHSGERGGSKYNLPAHVSILPVNAVLLKYGYPSSSAHQRSTPAMSTTSAPATASSAGSSGVRCFGLNIQWAEDDTYNFVNDLRTTHYPREHHRNPAHVSLFARFDVPPARVADVKSKLLDIALTTAPFSFKIGAKVHQWGKTVVLRVSSDKLYRMRGNINARWRALAIVNERERRDKSFQAHITIHARVSKNAACEAHGQVAEALSRYTRSNGALRGKAVGIVLVEYVDDGPWREVATYALSGSL